MSIKPAHESYQEAVREWVVACFGEEVADDVATRCWRFFEEAGELCQSLGMRKEDALKLVEYTWARPPGEPHQEMGGVMVTLAAMATPARLDMKLCGEVELARCWLNIEKIRDKQRSKAKLGLGAKGPLPGGEHVGRFVTLGVAYRIEEMNLWLPQQSSYMILADAGNDWILNSMQHSIDFLAPKSICSEPWTEAGPEVKRG